MRYIVGYAADDHGQEALELASWLATRLGAELTVAYIVPAHVHIATYADLRSPFPTEFRTQVESWLERAQGWIDTHTQVRAETRIVAASSPARGLVELAQELDAGLIVLGSSRSSRGRHFGVGTVSGQLLHFSPIPLALAPRGYTVEADAPLTRVWCGYVDTEQSREALVSARRLAARLESPLRLVNFVVPDGLGNLRSQDVEPIVARHRAEAEEQLRKGLADPAFEIGSELDVDQVIAEATSLDEAFDELDDGTQQLIVLGSSATGQVARVFLGGTASRLLRTTPWPVIAIPRGGDTSPHSELARTFPAPDDEEAS